MKPMLYGYFETLAMLDATARGFFQQAVGGLPADVKRRIMWKATACTPADFLASAFYWDRTYQRWDYWLKQHQILADLFPASASPYPAQKALEHTDTSREPTFFVIFERFIGRAAICAAVAIAVTYYLQG